MNVNKIDYEPRDWAESSRRKAGYRQTLKIGTRSTGFVWIPAGSFNMGSPKSEEDRAQTEVLHRVNLTKGFWMLETEVTQSLYWEIMETNPSCHVGDDLPVELVSWYDAMNFCKELTSRLSGELKASLPTEAQWEYSCRAGTKTAYWYGDVVNLNKMNNDKGKTTPVKSYVPNPWGLYDMHGNVSEWCLDYFGDYPSETVTDPKGPSDDLSRINRGGNYSTFAWFCRSASRAILPPEFARSDLGFRFILSYD